MPGLDVPEFELLKESPALLHAVKLRQIFLVVPQVVDHLREYLSVTINKNLAVLLHRLVLVATHEHLGQE